MRKNKLFLLAGAALLIGAGIFAAKTEAKSPMIEETKQALVMEAEPEVTETSTKPSGSTQAVPQRQWEDADTGYVIFGVTMGLTAALVVTMVLLRKFKPEAFKVEEKEEGGNE